MEEIFKLGVEVRTHVVEEIRNKRKLSPLSIRLFRG
jgi:hypothetical protein